MAYYIGAYFCWIVDFQGLPLIMITNDKMEESWIQETPVWNKENHPSGNSTQIRRKHLKTLALPRPATPLFQATFNPYPNNNGFSIPLIAPKLTPLDALASLSDSNDIREGLIKLSLKQKPIIAKSNKLKDFFTQESARYMEGETRERSRHRIRGKSLNMLSVRRESLQNLTDSVHKLTSKPVLTRKQEFQRLYLKQRQAFQRILIQHGIIETISDEDFTRFIGND